MKKIPLVAIIVVVILLLGLLARASLSNRKLDARFREEMAGRFDLEQKLLSYEKERLGLTAHITSLTGQLEMSQATNGDVRRSLDLLTQENKGLREALTQLRGSSGAQATAASSGAM